MMYRYLASCILFVTPVFADGLEPRLPDDLISRAMSDAENEYSEMLRIEEKLDKMNPEQIRELVTEIKSKTSSRNNRALTSLANQVDALTNRLIVETATLKSTQAPKNVRVKGATTVFYYKPDRIFEVTTAVDYITDIVLKPGEQITTPPTAGDTLRWEIGVMQSGEGENSRTHIILKATEENIQTNLLITTNQRTYHLSIKSGQFHMPQVSWRYREDFEARLTMKEYVAKTTERTVKPENLRFTYDISGDDVSWKPTKVFDDGLKTFIQMPVGWKTREAPAFFVLDDEDSPLLVNYRVEGDFYIVDRLFTKGELRVGADDSVEIELDDGKNFFERLFGL